MPGPIQPRLNLRPAWVTRLPPRTVRLRLTLLYGALFLVSGAVLLTITYLLVRHATGPSLVVREGKSRGQRTIDAAHQFLSGSKIPRDLPAGARQVRDQALHDHAATLHQLLIQSVIALGIMAIVSVALGWLVAGRVLRPLRTMTATTRRISEHNLHERLAIEGPRDELRDLGATVDGLLARLEDAFGAQKRFVSNAAHELRTPLTLLHALLEETLSDPDATIDTFRATSRRLLALGQEQERLIEALLTLASSERGLDHREPFDLAVVADAILLGPCPAVAHSHERDIRIDADIQPAPTAGDVALAERLVRNLIDNAVRYNIPGGTVEVSTGTTNGRSFFTVTNTGPAIPAADVERLFEPFQRLAPDRTADSDGHGLGLSIVRATATAHEATITTHASAEGGLEIHVNFPLRHPDPLDKRSAPRTPPDSERQPPQPVPATTPQTAASRRR
jgi:signal transduction histidine kinase